MAITASVRLKLSGIWVLSPQTAVAAQPSPSVSDVGTWVAAGAVQHVGHCAARPGAEAAAAPDHGTGGGGGTARSGLCLAPVTLAAP